MSTGLNGERRKLAPKLSDPSASVIDMEHGDRLDRVSRELLIVASGRHWGRIVWSVCGANVGHLEQAT